MQEITFDQYGRMQYHPEFHTRHGLPLTTLEQKYLIDNYDQLGPELCSLALERTYHSILTLVYMLRKNGLMPKPTSVRRSRRREIRPSAKSNDHGDTTSDISAFLLLAEDGN